MTDWSDVVARARGLASHLLGRDALRELGAARDLDGIAARLATSGYGAPPEHARGDPAALERYTRRAAAARLARLAQWCGRRVELLAPLFEDEDRRSLRALARAIAASAPGEQRALGLLPTPSLPERALTELAAHRRLSDVAALLVAWGHPFGPPMMAQAARPHPDLFALQLRVDREWARRALARARQAGSPLLDYVRLQIDAANVWALQALVRAEIEQSADALFLEGGSLVPRAEFERVALLARPVAEQELAAMLRSTPLAELGDGPAMDAGPRDEDLLLAVSLRALRQITREHPLGLGVVLEYLLCLRAELRDLGRIIWGVRLGIPSRRLQAALVTP